MKCVYTFLLLSGLMVLFHQPADAQVASAILDRVNVESYLRNPNMIQSHINCLVYNGHCDAIGKEIKRLLPRVGRQCRGCTPDQKRKLGRIFSHIQQNYPQAWNDITMRLKDYN